MGDYGSSVGLVGSRATFLCVTDALGRPPVLSYGFGYDDGAARCVSTIRGVRCIIRRTGHGFLVSREVVRFF